MGFCLDTKPNGSVGPSCVKDAKSFQFRRYGRYVNLAAKPLRIMRNLLKDETGQSIIFSAAEFIASSTII